MQRVTILLLTCLCAPAPHVGSAEQLAKQRIEHVEELAQQVGDKTVSSASRDTAFTALADADFKRALSIAPALLSEEDLILRSRAASVLAEGGQVAGLQVLRAMSAERTDESGLAIKDLGRLRDPGSHELLRNLLGQELSRDRPSPGRISSLVFALGDYGNSADAALLARTIKGFFGSGQWVEVDAVGRTGGRDAIPILEEIFQRSRGWTKISAGLGLARCGSPIGKRYVENRLADTSSGDPDNLADSVQSNAETDDPDGPRATDLILDRLGAGVDEIFVPDLLRIVSSPQYSWRAHAQAWRALLRINPVKDRSEILRLAWKNLKNEFAAQLIVLNEEAKARAILNQRDSGLDRYEQFVLQQALSATPRQRKRWRELHGYAL